ncbi:MAG: hypothetical protein R3D28_19605 [Geminicoccaceae bacterium]
MRFVVDIGAGAIVHVAAQRRTGAAIPVLGGRYRLDISGPHGPALRADPGMTRTP